MIGQSAGKAFAYLLGVFLGDGCVTKSGRKKDNHFRLNTIDQEFAIATQDAFRELTGKSGSLSSHPVSKSSKPNWSLSIREQELTAYLLNSTQRKSIIPDYVFGWPASNKLAFIGGLMDSEGYVAANSNTTGRRFYIGFKSCDVWFYDFIRLLQSVGIDHGKIGVEKPRQPHYKTPRRVTLKMQSWISSGARFNIRRKQQRVEEWANTEPDPRGLRFRAKAAPETTCTAPGNGMKI